MPLCRCNGTLLWWREGGVAKTTSCVNIATVLAERGKRVLVVDLDPQGGLTISLGFNPDEYNQTIYRHSYK